MKRCSSWFTFSTFLEHRSRCCLQKTAIKCTFTTITHMHSHCLATFPLSLQLWFSLTLFKSQRLSAISRYSGSGCRPSFQKRKWRKRRIRKKHWTWAIAIPSWRVEVIKCLSWIRTELPCVTYHAWSRWRTWLSSFMDRKWASNHRTKPGRNRTTSVRNFLCWSRLKKKQNKTKQNQNKTKGKKQSIACSLTRPGISRRFGNWTQSMG